MFTDNGVKAVCLICHKTVAALKKYNLKRPFQTKHINFGHSLSKQELQTKKATDMVKGLKQQQTVFEKTSSLQRSTTNACFVLANKIAKQNKSFVNAEFIKDCMIDAVSVVCLEVISLSRRTIFRCLDAIAMNI